MIRQIKACIFLFAVVLVTFLCYWPGVAGGFLFDDYSNLKDLGVYGGVIDAETFNSYVFHGWSGPTGRPISLMSFLLDDNTWPSYAPWFKKTNLYIHVLCGLLLCWSILLLLRNMKTVSENDARWIAVFACAIWLLHPYMVSTTLYVVQRMAQLATFFSLAGIVLYLYARLRLMLHPMRAYILMSLAVCVCTVLATFSKENGALLPLLILVIEFCLPSTGKPSWKWRVLFLWLPSVAIAVALSRYITFADAPWSNRNFNMVERLLTELRIVFDYLLNLFVPRIEGNGLYQDGYVISKSLFDPFSTFFCFLTLLFLFLGAFIIRRKAPIVTLSILFFFAAHTMESTVLGLELYFEHRNYLAALFLFLPLVYYCVILCKRFKLLPVLLVAVLAVLASMTWLRAGLWGDSDRLKLYWAQSATESPRAINSLAAYYIDNKKYEKANEYMELESERLSDSSLLTIRLLLQKIYGSVAEEQDFSLAGERLKNQQFDAQTVVGVRTIVETVLESDSTEYAHYTLQLLSTMEASPKYSQFPLFIRLTAYLRARLYLHLQEPLLANELYSLAMSRYNETDAALAMVAEMGSAGYPEEALVLLEQASGILNQQESSTLKRSRNSYEQEISYLEGVLKKATEPNNIVTEDL